MVLITGVSLVITILITVFLTFGRFARGENWRATVTPLASIIGSGFLVCGPLLAKEFGSGAILAMAALLAIAYAVGAVIRFNIVHFENFAATAAPNDAILWWARVAQLALAAAYAVSVAYYLKLLAEFVLRYLPTTGMSHAFASNLLVTALIAALAVLVLIGGVRRVEHVAHGTVALKMGIIGGMLAGLACWWLLMPGAAEAVPPAKFSLASVPLLLGLIITVQGFETSRYLGNEYSQAVRVRTMKTAQLLSAAIYIAFLALLTPLLKSAAAAEGVAGIIDVMRIVAAPLGLFVLVGAVTAQLSAAVADSIGSSGLLNELSRTRLSVPIAYVLASVLAIAIVWLTDPFQIIAVSSRAFAVFYALQCLIAWLVARRTGVGTAAGYGGIAAIGVICLVAAAIGAPAE